MTTVPCDVASVVVLNPAGCIDNATGHQIDVVKAPGSSASIGCCEEMVVKVCYEDCTQPFEPFSLLWRSTANGVTITDSLQWITFPESMKPLDVKNSRRILPPSEQNYPNPLTHTNDFRTMIPYVTEGTGTAEITITNAKGDVMINDEMDVNEPGKHFFYFSGKQLPAGTYYYQIQFPKGRVIVQRTMLIVK